MFTELLTSFYNALLALVANMGYLGIVILMTIESSFIPFPSELILIPAGALVAKGLFNPMIVFATSLAGSLFGALVNYYLALHFGRKTINHLLHKYGKIFLLKEEHILRSEVFFKKHGEIATFAGRFLPGTRSFISIPAGFYKMNLSRFCLFTVLGSAIPNAALIYVGYLFGTYEGLAKQYIGHITLTFVVLVAFIIGVYWLIKRLSKNSHEHQR